MQRRLSPLKQIQRQVINEPNTPSSIRSRKNDSLSQSRNSVQSPQLVGKKPKKKSRNIQYWINQVSQLRLLNFEKRLKRKDLVSKSINDQNPNFLLEMDDQNIQQFKNFKLYFRRKSCSGLIFGNMSFKQHFFQTFCPETYVQQELHVISLKQRKKEFQTKKIKMKTTRNLFAKGPKQNQIQRISIIESTFKRLDSIKKDSVMDLAEKPFTRRISLLSNSINPSTSSRRVSLRATMDEKTKPLPNLQESPKNLQQTKGVQLSFRKIDETPKNSERSPKKDEGTAYIKCLTPNVELGNAEIKNNREDVVKLQPLQIEINSLSSRFLLQSPQKVSFRDQSTRTGTKNKTILFERRISSRKVSQILQVLPFSFEIIQRIQSIIDLERQPPIHKGKSNDDFHFVPLRKLAEEKKKSYLEQKQKKKPVEQHRVSKKLKQFRVQKKSESESDPKIGETNVAQQAIETALHQQAIEEQSSGSQSQTRSYISQEVGEFQELRVKSKDAYKKILKQSLKTMTSIIQKQSLQSSRIIQRVVAKQNVSNSSHRKLVIKKEISQTPKVIPKSKKDDALKSCYLEIVKKSKFCLVPVNNKKNFTSTSILKLTDISLKNKAQITERGLRASLPSSSRNVFVNQFSETTSPKSIFSHLNQSSKNSLHDNKKQNSKGLNSQYDYCQ